MYHGEKTTLGKMVIAYQRGSDTGGASIAMAKNFSVHATFSTIISDFFCCLIFSNLSSKFPLMFDIYLMK